MASYYTEGADPNRIRTLFVYEDADYYYDWSSTGELKGKTAKSPMQKYDYFLRKKVVYEDYRGGKLRLTPANDMEIGWGMPAFNPYHHSSGQLFGADKKTFLLGKWFYSLAEVVDFFDEKNRPRPRYEDRPIISAVQIRAKEAEILENTIHAKEHGVPLPYTIEHLDFLIDVYYMSVISDSPRTLTGDGIAEAQQLFFNLKGVKDAKEKLARQIITTRPTATPKKETVIITPPEIIENPLSYSPLIIAGVIAVVVILLLKRRRA